ncbi:acyltransferase family protein [Thermomonas sp.]|uniref:acyltransferase family protein n=1 Tax=Thermomonas sp. TaxID=1971895 RepID=UPI0024877B48|nr:acyltransferase family protein [Thermomonas sp.]MDI1253002.1 acyltransferase family protein [Thermomonas sp.]
MLASGADFRILYAMTEGLFHGTTLFFALISGILFTRVLRGMPWARFYLNKFTNVILPYLVVSTVLVALQWPQVVAYLKANDLQDSFLHVLLLNVVTGSAEVQLWYIPVLAVLFVMTPALEAMLRFRNGVLLLLLALVPLVVSRTVSPHMLSVNSVIYFLGAYGFGMYLGERLEAMLALVRNFRALMWAVFLISLVANFWLFLSGYTPSGFFSLQESVVYLNKILAALLILELLQAHEDRMPRLLQTLGTYAFSLYFLHFTVMVNLDKALVQAWPGMSVVGVAAGALAIYLVSITLTLMLCIMLKKLFGRYSRMLIGA